MKQYFSFEGRAKRQEYWATIILSIVGLFIGLVLVEGGQALAGLVALVLLIAALWVLIAVTVKRLRDAGLHTLWTLLIFVPYISFVATIVFGCIGSAPENNDTSV